MIEVEEGIKRMNILKSRRDACQSLRTSKESSAFYKEFLIVIENYLYRLEEKANMRAYLFLSVTLFVTSVWLVSISGCKYNVSSPLYNQPSPYKAIPTIISVDPASGAKAGVNTITINGRNLVVPSSDSLTPSNTIVYFNGKLEADIVSIDSTAIVVYRPNVTGDSNTITVVPHNAAAEAKFSPYKIDPVIMNYGGFLQNLPLGAIAIDNRDSLFVMETTSKSIDEVTSPTDNVVLGGNAKSGQSPVAAIVGSDGNLFVLQGSRLIDRVNLPGGTVTQKWVTLPSGLVVKSGDCGRGGYLFLGGARTDLCIVSIGLSGSLKTSQITIGGGYASEEILAIKIYNGYVYIASRRSSSSPAIIWRNKIIADSTVGTREEVLDMSTTKFASDPITGIVFSSTGTMYLSTASTDPILVVNNGSINNFYKGIVPPYTNAMAWSRKSNYMYIISGNTAASQTWTVFRLDMGTTSNANF